MLIGGFSAEKQYDPMYIFIYLFIFKNKFIYFIYLFLAALGLPCCAWAFSSCGEQGLLFVAVTSLAAEHGL